MGKLLAMRRLEFSLFIATYLCLCYGCPQPNGYFAYNCTHFVKCTNGVSGGPIGCQPTYIFNPVSVKCESPTTTTYTCPTSSCREPNGYFAYNCTHFVECTNGVSGGPIGCQPTYIFNPVSVKCESPTTTTYTCPTSSCREPNGYFAYNCTHFVECTNGVSGGPIGCQPTYIFNPVSVKCESPTTTTYTCPTSSCREPNGYFAYNCTHFVKCTNGVSGGPIGCQPSYIFNPVSVKCESPTTTTYTCPTSSCREPNGYFAYNCTHFVKCTNGVSGGPTGCQPTYIFNPVSVKCESPTTTTYTCPTSN